MSQDPSGAEQIATASTEEGLDFACNLLAVGLADHVKQQPNDAAPLLQSLTLYVTLRYAGELRLALDELAGLGLRCKGSQFPREQFWAQVKWLATDLKLTPGDYEKLVNE